PVLREAARARAASARRRLPGRAGPPAGLRGVRPAPRARRGSLRRLAVRPGAYARRGEASPRAALGAGAGVRAPRRGAGGRLAAARARRARAAAGGVVGRRPRPLDGSRGRLRGAGRPDPRPEDGALPGPARKPEARRGPLEGEIGAGRVLLPGG